MTSTEAHWDQEADLLIFGSGAAGFSAGIFGRKQGLDVLICEKTGVIGGTTATSGGFLWVPGTAEAKAAGAKDSPELVRTYLRNELGNYYTSDLVEAFLSHGPDAITALQDGTDVVFDYVNWPDYHASAIGGVSEGRTIVTRPLDGRLLGKDFELVRPPIKRLMLLGGLTIDKRRVDDFLNPFRSFKGFKSVVTTLLRYASDRMSYSRGTDINAGNALIARMLLSLRKLKAEIWLDSPLEELIVSEGRVVGAVVHHQGRAMRIRARKAVILATGGFPHNAKMREELGPRHPHHHSVGYTANLGEGINAARSIGGVIDHDVEGPGLWQPSSLLKHKDGTEETILYGYLDRGRPGIIAVDRTGRRFVNESNSYHDIGQAMFRNGVAEGNRFYFICDRAFIWKRGLGMIRPFRPSLAPYERSGYITTGTTLEDLAAKLDIDATGLVETVARNNEFARTGVDPEFRRGEDPFNRMLGDPAVTPNPNLGPILKAPFIALQMVPSTLGTCIGLKTTANAEVVDVSGTPISGLYACGADVSSVMRGFYPGGGINLGPAVVFAYIAVQHAQASAASGNQNGAGQ